MSDDQAQDLLARIDAAADAVRRRPLSWEELDQLRCASRRLRRAIEIRTIRTSARCRGCDHMFVPGPGDDTYCTDACRSAAVHDQQVLCE